MPLLKVQDIAIIGAGPSGLAAAKYLLAEKSFSKIDIFEQSNQVGGVWNYTPDVRGTSRSGSTVGDNGRFRVPQTNAQIGLEKPVWKRRRWQKSDSGNIDGNREILAERAASSAISSCSAFSDQSSSSSQTSQASCEGVKVSEPPATDSMIKNQIGTEMELVFPSPMYEQLETNIPRTLMSFSDLSFAPGCQLFPRHQTVKEYIDEYAKELLPLVKFETRIHEVRLLEATKGMGGGNKSMDSTIKEKWSLKAEALRAGETYEKRYDAVVMANGHYSVPFVPDIEGAKEWNEAFPGTMSHSKSFRIAEEFRDKKVIIIGNSASGLDIGRQISKVCKKPLIVSQRSPSDLGPTTSSQIEEVPPIQTFFPRNSSNGENERSVLFANGRLESNVDTILFCTGYLYSYPMLSNFDPPPITDGARVEHTYEHLISAPHPSLAFMALPQKVIPFPVSEAQAAVLARLYSGRLEVPPLEVMEDWERETLKRKGGVGRRFHVLPFPEDGEYINRLLDWAAEADAAAAAAAVIPDVSDLMNARGSSSDIVSSGSTGIDDRTSIGKTRPKWGKREFWIRERFTNIRKAFLARGEERHGVRTLEELGFRFEGSDADLRKA